jgi:hypothetical protein
VIVDVPLSTPETTPVPAPIVATEVLPLSHVPPPASESVVVEPSHTEAVPEMADGAGLTVITVDEKQPEGRLYEITEVPEATPVTSPVDEPTVAIDVLPLVQDPPGVASLSRFVAPTQDAEEPVIEAGEEATLIFVVT